MAKKYGINHPLCVTLKSIILSELSLGRNRMKIGPRTKLLWGTSAFEGVGIKRNPQRKLRRNGVEEV